jgi:hypothetical protein
MAKIEVMWELDGIALERWIEGVGGDVASREVMRWRAVAVADRVTVRVPANTADKALAGLRDALDCVNMVRMWKQADEWERCPSPAPVPDGKELER